MSSDTVYYSVVEVARMIRRDLKAAFPGMKFSVRSNRYSGGSSIDIYWQDGPAKEQVKAVVRQYEGSTFDAMHDIKEYLYHKDEQGRTIHYSADHIFLHRYYSRAFLEATARPLADEIGLPLPAIKIIEWEEGRWEDAYFARDDGVCFGTQPLDQYLMREVQKIAAPEPEKQEQPMPAAEPGVPYLTEYKGHALLALPLSGGGELRFGRRKARALAAHLAAVRAFAAGEAIPDTPTAEVSEYKGRPLLALEMDGGRPFRFGRSKAQAVVTWHEAVAQFAAGQPLPERPLREENPSENEGQIVETAEKVHELEATPEPAEEKATVPGPAANAADTEKGSEPEAAPSGSQNQPHEEVNIHPQHSAAVGEVKQLPVTLIDPGDNDRQHFDAAALADLADSIRQHGLAQPITVRPAPDGTVRPAPDGTVRPAPDGTVRPAGERFQIVAGERRFRAVRDVLGWETIPAIVRQLDDESAAAIMLAENTGRADLNPIEEAEAYRSRMARFDWSVQRLAEVAGVSAQRVRDRLTLLRLIPDARHLVKFGHFPIGHALLMAGLDANRQRIALRVYNASEGMPAHRFKEVVDELLAEQQQEALFDLEALLIQSVQAADNTPLVRKGHRARTGAPAGKDLPPVRWMMRDSIAHVMERYIKDLLEAGEERAAGALGNVYNTLVGHNWMAVPANSILPKHGGPTAAELCHDLRMD